jgi:hypothetical protein
MDASMHKEVYLGLVSLVTRPSYWHRGSAREKVAGPECKVARTFGWLQTTNKENAQHFLLVVENGTKEDIAHGKEHIRVEGTAHVPLAMCPCLA